MKGGPTARAPTSCSLARAAPAAGRFLPAMAPGTCAPAAGRGGSACCSAAPSAVGDLASATRLGVGPAEVAEYYGKTLSSTADLKTSACTAAGAPPPAVRAALARVPAEVVEKFYGCGSPLPAGLAGLRVLDLGSGSGRDCYVAAALVGEAGAVVGVDMTDEQLAVARAHADAYCTRTLGYARPNLRFVKGEIEDLAAAGIEDGSFDLVISNCVVNLSRDKAAVLRGAYAALAPGGEMHFSDVYADRRLPAAARGHPVLVGECLGGALYEQDFLRLARAAGFADPRRAAPPAEIAVADGELRELLGGARFFSVTYRLFKLPGALESLCEDYGQAARYRGTVPGAPHAYVLDDHHAFQAGKWYEVCGNTAAMVGESWLRAHFEVAGDRSVHYGLFDCGGGGGGGGAAAGAPAAAAAAPAGGGCC